MSKKIRITKKMKVRVLTYSGMESEYHQGMPEAWAKCFGMKNQTDQDEPTFNRILYLQNVNISPKDAGVMARYLPIWHAAVITFKNETPANLLLIREVSLMGTLIQTYSPTALTKNFFPSAKTSEIKVDIIDAQEKPRENGVSCEFPIIVYEGWPSEGLRENWLILQHTTTEMIDAAGGRDRTDFTYTLRITGVDIRLHFVDCVLNSGSKELWWIQRDEMNRREG